MSSFVVKPYGGFHLRRITGIRGKGESSKPKKKKHQGNAFQTSSLKIKFIVLHVEKKNSHDNFASIQQFFRQLKPSCQPYSKLYL